MKLAAIWEFVAGDSRLAPLGVAVALAVAVALLRSAAFPSSAVGVVFAALVALGLAAAVFERG